MNSVNSVSKVCIQSEFTVHHARHHSESLILCYSFFEEVGFSLQWNWLHEVKWIFHFVDLWLKEKKKKEEAVISLFITIHIHVVHISELPWPVRDQWEAGQPQTQCTASWDNSWFLSDQLAMPLLKTPTTWHEECLHIYMSLTDWDLVFQNSKLN